MRAPGESPLRGALKVGPGEFDGSWWRLGDADVTTRACLLDDLYILGSDGSFSNDMGGETWLEGWQGVDEVRYTDEPHDGSVPAMVLR